MVRLHRPVVLIAASGLLLALTGCVGGGDAEPSPTTSASASASSPSTVEPAPEPTSAPPVPTTGADAWTDDTGYAACVEHAGTDLEAGYTWYPRTTQALVAGSDGTTIDITGVFTGGDVGVANVTYGCVLGGTQAAPEISGALVR